MGWTYNTKDPNAPTIGPMITGVTSALTILSLVTVCLRTYCRVVILKAFGIDDWIIPVTWVAAAGFAIVTIVQTKWGLGLRHIDDLPAEDIYNFGLLQYIGAPFYISSILGFKLALLFSYLRFVPMGIYRHAVHGVITACILFHLAFLIVQINLCQPARKQWDPSVTWGTCIAGVPFYTSVASITILFDVTVMLLPFPILLKSRIQTRKKLVLLALFGLGTFITVIQIIRIQTVKRLVHYTDSAPLILWSAVENNLGLIVANVPTLAPLVKYYHEQRSSRGGSKGGNNTHGGLPSGYGGNTKTNNNSGGVGASLGYARGSRYARSRLSSRAAAGMQALGSMGGASVHDGTELGSFGAAGRCVSSNSKGNGSMDSILDSSSSGRSIDDEEAGKVDRHRDDDDGMVVVPGAISKKVEVVITRT